MQYETYQAISGTDTSQIQFQINPPVGGCTLKGKSLVMKLPLTVIITRKSGETWATPSTPFPKRGHGLAQFPFARVMEEMTVLVNGEHEFKYTPHVYHHALKSYTKLDDPKVQQEFATPDIFSNFRGYTTAYTQTAIYPLAAHGSHTPFMSRASHFGKYGYYVDANGEETTTPTATAAAEFVVSMPIPMEIFKKDIHNITTINVTCKMMPKDMLMFIYNADGSLGSTLLDSNFDFQFKTFQFPVPVCTALWEVPDDPSLATGSTHKYKNKRYEVFTIPDPKQVDMYHENREHSVSSSIFTFGKADKMYVYTRMDPYRNTSIGANQCIFTSAFGLIRKMTLMLNHRTYFTNYDEHMLWEMSSKNGYFHTFFDAHGGSPSINGHSTGAGTVVCVDFPKDIKVEDVNTAKISVDYDYVTNDYCYMNMYIVLEYDEEVEF